MGAMLVTRSGWRLMREPSPSHFGMVLVEMAAVTSCIGETEDESGLVTDWWVRFVGTQVDSEGSATGTFAFWNCGTVWDPCSCRCSCCCCSCCCSCWCRCCCWAPDVADRDESSFVLLVGVCLEVDDVIIAAMTSSLAPLSLIRARSFLTLSGLLTSY